MKISKELLSEVMQLGILEVGEIDDCYLSFNYYILDDDNIKACINIYKLAHKCKEWAYNKGFKILSGERLQDTNASFIVEVTDDSYETVYKEIYKTETEAIFKACEWILKEIKK